MVHRKKTGLKEKYKLSGSFETLMMHYGGRERNSFQMMDLKEFVRFYGHRGLKSHLSAHDRAKGGDEAATSLRR